MNLGLLACDHIQTEFPDYPELFESILPTFTFKIYNVCEGIFPDSANDCDSWLITGSKYSVYDDIDWINKLKVFVQDIAKFNKPCIGVCFGHQMLGEAMGGKVQKSDSGWCVGVHEFEMLYKESWMEPFHNKLNLLMSCQDQIKTLPPNSKILAKSPLCPVGMIQIGSNMLGIQGHPEFSYEYVKYLMLDRTNRIGEEIVNQGLASLMLPIQSKIVSDWMIRFLSK